MGKHSADAEWKAENYTDVKSEGNFSSPCPHVVMKEEEEEEDDAISVETPSKPQPGILPAHRVCCKLVFTYTVYIVSSRKPAAIITVQLTYWHEAKARRSRNECLLTQLSLFVEGSLLLEAGINHKSRFCLRKYLEKTLWNRCIISIRWVISLAWHFPPKIMCRI